MSAINPVTSKALFESDAFAQQYSYDGPLGPDYTPQGTYLRLWAPTALRVSVNLYRRGDGGFCIGTLPMERREKGAWTIYLPGDKHGLYYTFTVQTEDGARETGDPYARAAGVNGIRSMIVDLRRTDPPDWAEDCRPDLPPSRRAIWEVSVRDFSQDPASGVPRRFQGKYLAFTLGTTTLDGRGACPTGLNHLRRLPPVQLGLRSHKL